MTEINYTAEELKNEIWKPCVEDDRYAVSNLGRVKRTALGRGVRPKRLLNPIKSTNGYLVVSLGVGRHWAIHRLVCRAFAGDPMPHQTDCNHKDFDRTNNRVENLEWCTRKENLHYSKSADRDNKGERNGRSKLTIEQVRKIRCLFASTDLSNAAIGEMFNVSDGAIRFIRIGKRWSQVE